MSKTSNGTGSLDNISIETLEGAAAALNDNRKRHAEGTPERKEWWKMQLEVLQEINRRE